MQAVGRRQPGLLVVADVGSTTELESPALCFCRIRCLSPMEQAEVGPCLQVTAGVFPEAWTAVPRLFLTPCPSMPREFLLGTGIRPESSEHRFTNVAFHSFTWDVVLSVDEAF